jgi:hypothetical protein
MTYAKNMPARLRFLKLFCWDCGGWAPSEGRMYYGSRRKASGFQYASVPFYFCRDEKTARPQTGRPLQNPLPALHDGFVAASPSRGFRDGLGIFVV